LLYTTGTILSSNHIAVDKVVLNCYRVYMDIWWTIFGISTFFPPFKGEREPKILYFKRIIEICIKKLRKIWSHIPYLFSFFTIWCYSAHILQESSWYITNETSLEGEYWKCLWILIFSWVLDFLLNLLHILIKLALFHQY
jgi:hypothetical protein